MNKEINRKGRRVLVTRFSAIGDVAMTVPVLYSVCRTHPDDMFYMVTRPSMTPIFVNPPENLVVIGADVKSDYKGLNGMNRLLKELCDQYYIDTYVDLHAVLRTFALSALCRLRGIKVSRINKGRRGKRALTRRNNKVMLPLLSSRARYREAFFRAGFPMSERFDGVYGKNNRAPFDRIAEITSPKSQGEKWLGIAPFAKHKGKIYPLPLMEQVVKEIAQLPNVKIFLFGGGEQEQAILRQWAEKYPNTISLAEKRWGFAREMELMSHLDVMLTMDSANMHLASLVNVPVVSIWGATHPYCGFKGWRQKEDLTLQLPMPCRPCSTFGNKPCYRSDYLCLSGIPPTSVVAKLKPFLI